MNHFLLPTSPKNDSSNTRYGAAIDTLVESMANLGCSTCSLEAQIFGGGAVVEHLTSVGADIGERNILLAKSRLAQHRIKVVHQNVGGELAQKIHFDSVTGQVIVKKIDALPGRQNRCAKTSQLSRRKIRALTVDDSPTVLAIYRKIIELDGRLELIGQAHDAYEARDMIVSFNPDVITLDIIMPKMSGLEFIRKLMKYYPKAVVIISTIAKVGSKIQKMALSAGACDVIDKESLNIYGGLEKAKNILLRRLKAAGDEPTERLASLY
ncbi:MAG: response regulator [Sedimentisphaerales bacterium]|nr:response regulator [Sedimentisphaerales bacterium]